MCDHKDNDSKNRSNIYQENTTFEINTRSEYNRYSTEPTTNPGSNNEPPSISNKLNQSNNSERNNNG